jgi:hypothetical protein
LLGVLVAVFGLQALWAPDFGIHLATGRWILDHGRVPQADVFTYTVAGARDIDLWWIYHLLLALVERFGGLPWLVISNALLTLVSFGLAVHRTLRRSPGSGAVLSLLVLLGILAWNFEVRPHVLSWIYLNGILFVVERYREDRTVPLWPIVVLQCLWINSQPLGAMGWGILGAVVAGQWITDRSLDRKLLAYSTAAIGSAVVNPYFLEGLTLPLTQFGFLRSPTIFKQHIYEFISPFTTAEYAAGGRPFYLQSLFPFHLYAVVALAGALAGVRRRSASDLLVFAVLGYLFVIAQKNFGFFFFGTLPFLVQSFQTRLESSAPRAGREAQAGVAAFIGGASRLIRRWGWMPVSAAAVVLILLVRTDGYYVLMRANLRFGVDQDSSRLPVATVRFLREHDLNGRVMNTHDIGGYLMATVPQRIFIDGRHHVIGESLFREYLSMRTRAGMEAAVERYRPDIIIFPYSVVPEWLLLLQGRKEWRLASYDDVAAVFLRNGYAPHVPELLEDAALAMTSGVDESDVDSLLDARKPTGPAWLLGALTAPQRYPYGESNRSIFAYAHGWPRMARAHGLRALAESTVESSALHFNMGNYLFAVGEFRRAAVAYRRFLEMDTDPLAVERLKQAEMFAQP